MKDIIKKLEKIMNRDQLLENEPMRNHTSFKVGGPADLLIIPKSLEELKKTLEILRETEAPKYIFGNGSNLLVKDNGYRGIMIKTQELKKVEVQDVTIIAEPGILLKDLANIALLKNLRGLEFASGIPGTLGGAVFMNAGAYDGEMKNIVTSIKVLTETGEVKEIKGEDCEFGYRHSILQKEPWILIGIKLSLSNGDYNEIKDKMDDFNGRRKEKQPLEYPSAGSTFRRPPGYFAGKLVEDAGFRGAIVGGAQVSEKHSGFVINKNNATAAELLTLIEEIQKGVKDQFGVDLFREVIVIGE